MKRIRILLVEDHMIVRQGLRKMLELNTDLEIAGEAEDGRQAIAKAIELRPDVILMDIAMPRLNGLEATRQIHKEVPGAKILILSAYSDDAYVKSAAESGAAGFLLKQTSADEVYGAIRSVHKGENYFTPAVARHLSRLRLRAGEKGEIVADSQARLTPRQREVLQLVAEGLANKEIAAELGISIKTVEKHRAHLMQALDIHDTASLTRYAITAGVIESSVQVTLT
jgi:DNA-binding NarL/FixJ family response regulator